MTVPRGARRLRHPALVAVLAAATLVSPVTARAATAGQGTDGHPLAPTGLRADGRSQGVLTDNPSPHFAWVVRDTGRAEAQTAYQIRVSPASARGAGSARGWDSGRVRSADSTDVRYDGPPLVSDRTYTWQVRSWNKEGEASPWSTRSTFDTGLLNATDWSASWLRVGDGALVRDDFRIDKPVARARLYFGAQGIVEPHLNGARVTPTQVLDSSVTDYDSRVLYRSLDVTKQLRGGDNALAFMAGKGQFDGDPVFVAQLDVTYADGSTDSIGTDRSWKTTPGPVTGDDFWFGETYDARKELPGWDAPGYDAAAWKPVNALFPVTHGRSLAQGRPVTALDTTTTAGWSPAGLTDGIDASVDASEGYHSQIADRAESTKWVQTDLGQARDIRSVRLFPARPTNDTAGDFPAAGFPVRYKVQVSDDPSFADATTLADHTDEDQPSPGVDPVDIRTHSTARYVRVTATKLPCIGSSCTFRLAELGVYGERPATVAGAMTDLRADVTPPTRIVENRKPVEVHVSEDGNPVYDFGQNIVGWAGVTASLPSGTKIDITQGEILDSHGGVTTSNISFADSDAPRQTNHYTAAGSGTATYAPHFGYAGFRYAEIHGLPAGAHVTVSAHVVHTDVATTGSFSTSDPLLNKIQNAVTTTQLNNLQSLPMDCPTRERHGWLGDAGDSDEEAMANFDMESFYDKWLGDIATSANADGSVPSVAPANGGQNDWKTDPAWGTAYPQIVWNAYVTYGSKAPITQHYTRIKAWVDYLATISDSDRVVTGSPMAWGDDWLSTVSTPHGYFQTAFSYLDATLVAKMARVLGQDGDASRYAARAEQIKSGFLKRYYDASTGVFGNGSQLSYAMPLVLGLVPEGKEQESLDRLIKDVRAHDDHATTGFVGTTYVFQALGAFGRNDVALDIAQRKDAPSFGYMVEQGPGTIWEKWPNSSAADGTSSKDHIGLGGAIGQWYYQQLAGIRAGESGPGFGAITLAPSVVGDLSEVSAKQQTVRGDVVSSWKRDGDRLTYHVSIPVGATADIRLPLLGSDDSTVREGRHTIHAPGGDTTGSPGLKVGRTEGGTLALTAGSGDYTFTVVSPAA
ncbi:family 78 glycoside hydrolase catalytic domain [Streptomyces sp. SID14478]|uniref:family 78 glycoside hydrolase catalytic domain n=1 Tax=Streptomyces sp. SID14478 TaxID=2706073 RepID=UPI0013E0BF0F|nr:family 78 glycoside hydrolase catalytic domain [Streptomyces sp. SID14478]NEB80948.1 family 78 glycoside hydrolase catalytic domain [Streptomyces sp. SID14478]